MNDPGSPGAEDMWNRLADERLKSMTGDGEPLPEEPESARMLRELLIHQVELEMQNEELLETRAEIKASAEWLRELYDLAPVGYFSLSATGGIRQLNLMGADMLGRERGILLGASFGDYVPAEDHPTFARFLKTLFAGEPADACEIRLTPHGRPPFIVRMSGLLSPNGLVCRVAAMDVTNERQAQNAADEKNEDLNRIFELSPDLIAIATMDGEFIRLNPAFERTLGFTITELAGRNALEFVHPGDHEATMRAMAKLNEGRMVVDFTNRYQCRDGSHRWLEWRASPYRGKFICALARDITERKRTEDALRVSEEQFRSIVESSPMAMYLYHLAADDRLVLVGANPAADRETGISHGSLHGKTVEEAFPALVGTGVPELYKSVARGTLPTQSFVIRYDDDRIAGHFDVRVFQTSPRKIAVAFMNITDRMAAAEALKRAHDELESRVERRTAQLRERTVQLRALASEAALAEERERRRIALVIHDGLQQTLVAALLNLGMMKAKLPDPTLEKEADAITGMLRDAIHATRSLATELSPPVLQQSGLIAALNWLRTWCMEQYGLDVRLHADTDVEAGAELKITLFRCVRELLFNAVKHSGVNSVELRLAHGDPGEMIIEVRDGGSGFDPEEVRNREGSEGGFGLFSIRERLEVFGGGLEIHSAPGAGSRITLRFPLQGTGEVPVPAPPAEDSCPVHSVATAPQAGTIRIVIADDHAAVREGLARLLESQPDIEVVGQAANGLETLELAARLLPDFVVTDLNMPHMDGQQTTRELRKKFPHVGVIGFSTEADAGNRDAMIRAGAIDLIHKNSSPDELIATLRRYAGSAHAS
jgi:PAS domain S-box-containing protein